MVCFPRQSALWQFISNWKTDEDLRLKSPVCIRIMRSPHGAQWSLPTSLLRNSAPPPPPPPFLFQSYPHPPFSPWNARCNTHSLSQTQRERETGTEYRTCRLEKDFFFLFLNEKELEKRHCKTKMWLPIFAFFLSLLCYCMLLFSSLLFPFPSFYLSLSLPLCISQAFRVCDFSCGRKWMDDIYFSLPALILLFRYCV